MMANNTKLILFALITSAIWVSAQESEPTPAHNMAMITDGYFWEFGELKKRYEFILPRIKNMC